MNRKSARFQRVGSKLLIFTAQKFHFLRRNPLRHTCCQTITNSMHSIPGVFVFGLVIWSVGNGLAQPQTQFNVKNYEPPATASDWTRTPSTRPSKRPGEATVRPVLVPAGSYVSGTIHLQSNVTLWIDAGATILGSKNLSDYRWPKGERDWYAALILAQGVHDVSIMGRGTINGQNLTNPKGEERVRGPHGVLFYNCKDVLVRDVTFKDPGNYALIMRSCERVNIDNMTALGGYDGINMHDVRAATISNSRLFTGDDCLAGAYWENVTVSNCLLNSSCNAIRAGGRNVLINNCLIYGPGSTFTGSDSATTRRPAFRSYLTVRFPPIRVRQGWSDPGPVDNMVLSNITMINVHAGLCGLQC